MQPLTIHLPDAEPQERVDVWEMVSYLTEMPGWTHFTAAVSSRIEGLQMELLNKPVRESAGDYERIIGEMRGLSSIEGIIEGLRKRAEEVQLDG